ncbi:MAG: septum formation initiator family protein [Burkholderiaceae bacterium]|jgi:cell division protein FtsB|nr:septum formation initiator family protein [Burkholderiaceae bacterium]MDP4800999.1 septum formation initiator family protein [Burkholderiaceae bacterium]
MIRQPFRLRWPSLAGWMLLAVLGLQLPLWFGQGGWIQVWRMQADHADRLEKVQAQRVEIQELEAEVKDLQSGLVTAEERARYEMGLMRPGERFVQVRDISAATAGSAGPAGSTAPSAKGR